MCVCNKSKCVLLYNMTFSCLSKRLSACFQSPKPSWMNALLTNSASSSNRWFFALLPSARLTVGYHSYFVTFQPREQVMVLIPILYQTTLFICIILGIELTNIDTELIHHNMAIAVWNIKESRCGTHYPIILNVLNRLHVLNIWLIIIC